ncbi:hypothetical protein H2248_002438 [Termitomyces sp. 'cryptogamus']|nr:hypothetical protein H2248_002438 [Termitomyces sp. 'cryptogamus']
MLKMTRHTVLLKSLVNSAKVIAIKISRRRSPRHRRPLSNNWLDNLVDAATVVRTTAVILPFPYAKGAAETVLQILQTIQKARKNVDDFEGLLIKLVYVISTVRDAVCEWPSVRDLPREFVHYCVRFQEELLDLQKEINGIVRYINRWTRLSKSTEIGDTIARYEKRIDNIAFNFISTALWCRAAKLGRTASSSLASNL